MEQEKHITMSGYGRLSRQYECLFERTPAMAVAYAQLSMRGRWKRLEPMIMECPKASADYAVAVLKRRWRRAESVIITHPVAAAHYASKVIRGRWTQAESTIAKNDAAAQLYADNCVRHWTHEFAMMSPVWLYCYAERVSCGMLPPTLHKHMLLRSFAPEMKNNHYVQAYFAKKRFRKR